MINFEKACGFLNNLLEKGHNGTIKLDSGEEYSFLLTKKYTDLEIRNFEKKFDVTFPQDYKYFLENVGASTIYVDEYGLGIQFYALEEIVDFSNSVFVGMNNLFPKLFIIASNIGRGDIIGFDFSGSNIKDNFAIFSHEDNPEKWLEENSVWSQFNLWLCQLVESEGEEDLI